jgi:predicted DNA-binding transcriptional regulator AlpA
MSHHPNRWSDIHMNIADRTTLSDPLLNIRESAELTGISTATLWRRVADGTFPKPVKLGSLSRWPRSELVAALERLKDRRAAA